MTHSALSYRSAFALLLLLPGTACEDSASASASAAAPAQSAPAPNASAAAACGGKGLPDCPLQGWMKSTVQAYMTAGDAARLAKALDELGRHPPAGYANWSEAALAAAAAARAGDVAAVRAQCQACHEQHRAKFRAEMRSVRLF
jgi:cytochrome c5